MQQRGSSLFAFAFLYALAPSPQTASAQPQAAPAPGIAEITLPAKPSSDDWEGRIKLDVVVADQSGKPVSGLEGADFSLFDNGRPAKIVSFSAFDGTRAMPDPPVEVILVIDAANHPADDVSDVQHGIGKFLSQNGGQLAQRVSIYRLSDDGLAGTPKPCTDGNALAQQLTQKNGLRDIRLDSADYNQESSMAAPSPSYRNPSFHRQSAIRTLGSIVLEERRKPGRKLLFWVGYGGAWDDDYGRGPGPSFREDARFEWITEFSTRLREARITMFAVSFWQSPDKRFPYQDFLQGVASVGQARAHTLGLAVLATQSGGRVLEEPDNDLARLISQCVAEASSFYTISFDAPRTNQPDEYHDLKVEVDKPGLVARTDSGYYDQPVYYDQPYVAADKVSVDQLDQRVAKAQGASDAELARQLSSVELTERLSSAKLLSLKARMRGEKARAALSNLADASVFLDPPAAEVPSRGAPDAAAQRLMLSRTVDYLIKAVPRLPDFFAIRTTAHYQEPPHKEGQTWKTAAGDRSLHLVGSSSVNVLYRGGYEEVDLDAAKRKRSARDQGRLNTKGTFGPILSVVMLDAASSNLVWSRWEQAAGGPRAVFRYTVPSPQSHYEVSYRGLLEDGDTTGIFQHLTGYHGEVAIDPESGTILRMTVDADLEPNLPILRSSIMVEYGPVEIGSFSHICLLRSVSIARVRTIFGVNEWGESFRVYGPFETMLDDVAFDKYHMFHGEARILTGFSEEQEQK